MALANIQNSTTATATTKEIISCLFVVVFFLEKNKTNCQNFQLYSINFPIMTNKNYSEIPNQEKKLVIVYLASAVVEDV